MAFQIHITTGGSSPIYRQIIDQIRLAVATGQLAPDEQLPSVRAQAERLVVNPNTVARAYNELVQAGVLRAHQGRGLFVNGKRAVYGKSERQRRVSWKRNSRSNSGPPSAFHSVSKRFSSLLGGFPPRNLWRPRTFTPDHPGGAARDHRPSARSRRWSPCSTGRSP